MIKTSVLITTLLLVNSLLQGQSLVLKASLDYPTSGIQYTTWLNGIGGQKEWMINDWGTRDFNGDGHSDLLFVDHINGLDYLRVLGPDFNELWNSYPELPWISLGSDVSFLDIDGDGNKEIIHQTGSTSGTLTIYSIALGQCIFSADETSDHYFIVDYEHDGLPDIVTHNQIAYTFEIWGAGTTTSAPPSDLTILPEGDDLHLHWQEVDSCSMYTVEWSFTLNGDYASVGTSCLPEFIHPGASIVPRAYYRVKAITSTWGEIEVGSGSFVRNCNR